MSRQSKAEPTTQGGREGGLQPVSRDRWDLAGKEQEATRRLTGGKPLVSGASSVSGHEATSTFPDGCHHSVPSRHIKYPEAPLKSRSEAAPL